MIQKLQRYYKKAIRTTLLAHDKLSKDWVHLFSVIELQTEDEYPYHIPNAQWKDGCIRATQSNLDEYTFYLSVDEILSIDDALNAFNNPSGNFTIDNKK